MSGKISLCFKLGRVTEIVFIGLVVFVVAVVVHVVVVTKAAVPVGISVVKPFYRNLRTMDCLPHKNLSLYLLAQLAYSIMHQLLLLNIAFLIRYSEP